MEDEAEEGNLVMHGDPSTGTPTMVMKGWGALEALMKSYQPM